MFFKILFCLFLFYFLSKIEANDDHGYIPYYHKGFNCQSYLYNHSNFCATIFDDEHCRGHWWKIPKNTKVNM